MTHKCASCQRVLYSLRRKTCGFCGAPIPANVQFTPEEIAALDRQISESEKQRRQRQQAADEAGKEARRRDAGVAASLFIGFQP